MARPKKAIDQVKSESITIHCTTKEYNEISMKAGENESMSEFCLKSAMGQTITMPDTITPRLLYELQKIGTNINQIAARLNKGDDSLNRTDLEVIDQAQNILNDIKSEIIK